jgi:hypothetical protein
VKESDQSDRRAQRHVCCCPVITTRGAWGEDVTYRPRAYHTTVKRAGGSTHLKNDLAEDYPVVLLVVNRSKCGDTRVRQLHCACCIRPSSIHLGIPAGPVFFIDLSKIYNSMCVQNI